MRRALVILSCFLIVFSVTQTGLLFYMQGRAAAQTAQRQDPISAVRNGYAPKPLKSDRLIQDKFNYGSVSQSLRDQVSESSDSAAPPRLKDIDRSHEDRSKRTLNSRTYNSQGSKVVEITGANTSYKDKNTGELKDIDINISDDQEYIDRQNDRKSFWQKLKFWDKPRAYKANGGPLNAAFPTLHDGDSIAVESYGKQMSMRPAGANQGIKPERIKNDDGSTAIRYANVWEGVDLVYEYSGDAVKEMIVLRERPSRTNFEFEFDKDVSFNKLKDGGIEVIKNGHPLFYVPEITVMAAQKGPVSDSGAEYVIDGNRLTAKISGQWLDLQQKENYPIAIDPTINAHQAENGVSGAGASDFWSYKSDGYQCNGSACYQNVGWLNDNGHKRWRTMMRIPFDQALGKDLVHAQLDVAKVNNGYTWSGTDSMYRYWVTWAPCFGFDCIDSAAPWIPMSITTGGWIDLTQLIQWMKDNNQTGGWLMIHGDDSPYKALNEDYSKLSLVYNRRPSKPGLSGPGNNSVQTTAMPKLTASASTDPDGDALDYQFEIYDGNTLIAQSPRQKQLNWVVPDGILHDGGTYKWRVVVRDTYNITWSSDTFTGVPVASDKREFTVDLRLGNKDKTQSYDELGPIAANLANGNAYTSVDSHSIDSLGGDIGLSLEYNTPQLSQRGLTATYHNSTNGTNPVLKRIDPNIDYHWDAGSPAPGVVGKDNFSVKWDGYFVAPKTGTYRFGASNDDRFWFDIDTGSGWQRQFDYNCCNSQKMSSTTVNLAEGGVYPIRAMLTEYGDKSYANLWVDAPGFLEQKVPQQWLRTKDFVPTNDKQGLRAEFYKDYDQSRQFKSNQAPYLVKNVPNVNLNWKEGSSVEYDPGGNYKDNFLVRFSGYITIPTNGTYKFGINADDGKRLYINGNKVAEQWNTNLVDAWSSNMSFSAGDVVPVVLEYFEAGGGASVQLKWEGPAGNTVIPSRYFSSEYRNLPDGWNLSVDASGDIAYERLRVMAGGNVALISGDGTRHVYKQNGGGYKPPANEYGVLSRQEGGGYTLQDVSGQVYEFDVKGVLTRVTSPVDDRQPAAMRYEYQDQSGVPRLKKIIDGVDGQRWGELFYGGDSQCQTPSGFDAAPAGFICAFTTYDGQTTHFYYKNDQLSRVELPGSAFTDIGNDEHGRITSVRGVLANDAIATGTRTANDELLTQISYDAIGRVSLVRGPSAQPGGARTEHTLDYGYNQTDRHIADAPEPEGYSQHIEYDELGRTTKACDQQGLCAEQEWHTDKDLLLSSTDALGLMSTTIYDEEDRPVESYGPAPKEWFNTWNETLQAGQELTRGQYIKSLDGRYTFTYQTNGNLVVRDQAGVVWHAGMNNQASTRLVMQSDGNLVLRNGNTAVWSTGTGGQGDSTSYLVMQNNGNLVLRTKPAGGGTRHYWHLNINNARVQVYSDDYLKPNSTYAGQIPRSSTAYDEGMTGPEVVWYNFRNGSLHGEPRYRQTGFDQNNPSKFWTDTTNPVSPEVPVEPSDGATRIGFRATGQIKVPASGDYTLKLWHANAARVYVNDQVVMDGWDYRSNSVVSKTASINLKSYEENKLTVEYANAGGGNTSFRLELSGNGTSTPDGVWGDLLKPGYGLVTSTTAYDAVIGDRTSRVDYGARPEYGLAQSATADPGGLNLTTSSSYEEPGSGYLRQTSKTLPGSSQPTFSYGYYGADETRDNPCTVETESYRQAGRMKIKTEAGQPGSASQPASTNLVPNPSFEQASGNPDRPESWNTDVWGDNTNSFEYLSEGRTGSRSVKVEFTSHSSGDAKWRFDPVAINPDTEYTYSDYYKSTTNSDVLAEFTHQDQSKSYQWLGALQAANDWTQASFNFTAPAAATHVNVMHRINSTGWLVMDDAEITSQQQQSQQSGGGELSGAITHETVYDNAGRAVASRTNDDPWTCVTYDDRGRATQTVVPDINGRPGRTVTTSYSFEGSPFKTQTADTVSGTTVSEVDLLGRTIAGTDQFGLSFSVAYDDLGRMIQQVSPVGTEEYTYDDHSRVTAYKLDGTKYASVSYDQYGRMNNVVYDQADNGSGKLTLEQIKYDALQRNNGAVYRFADGKAFDETVNLSTSGIVTGYTDTFDGQTATGSYAYDKAGRLTEAVIDQNKYEYGYGAPDSAVCNQADANPNAHKNSNRTSFAHTNLSTDESVSSQTYCYDQADRLLSYNTASQSTTTQTAPVNLIPNPSLEQASTDPNRPESWHTNSWGDNTVAFTYQNEGRTGSRSIKTEFTTHSSGDAKWRHDPVPVSGSTEYTYTDYYKSTTASDLLAEFTHQDQSKTYQWLGALQAANDWTQASYNFTTPATATHVNIQHRINSAGWLVLDDVELVEANPSGGTTQQQTQTTTNPTYDDHNNTVELDDGISPITFEYNAANANISIQQANNRVEYLKTSTGTILRKKVYQNNNLVESYRYLAGGKVMQMCDVNNDTNCTTTDTYLSLPGGVTLTLSPNNPDTNKQAVYSVANFHGDTAITTNNQGIPTTNIFMYEPYGQTAYSQTFNTGTNPNGTTTTSESPHNATDQPMTWAANPTRKQETLFTTTLIQMGARVYLPTTGRFLQPDPIEGGTLNAYTYVNDPINSSDYSGLLTVVSSRTNLRITNVSYNYGMQPHKASKRPKASGPASYIQPASGSSTLRTTSARIATPKATPPPKPNVSLRAPERLDVRGVDLRSTHVDGSSRNWQRYEPEGFSWQKLWPRIKHGLETGSQYSEIGKYSGATAGCLAGGAAAVYGSVVSFGGTLLLSGAACLAAGEVGSVAGQVGGAAAGLTVGLITY